MTVLEPMSPSVTRTQVLCEVVVVQRKVPLDRIVTSPALPNAPLPSLRMSTSRVSPGSKPWVAPLMMTFRPSRFESVIRMVAALATGVTGADAVLGALVPATLIATTVKV